MIYCIWAGVGVLALAVASLPLEFYIRRRIFDPRLRRAYKFGLIARGSMSDAKRRTIRGMK